MSDRPLKKKSIFGEKKISFRCEEKKRRGSWGKMSIISQSIRVSVNESKEGLLCRCGDR